MKHRRTTQVIRKNPHSDFCLKRLDIQNYRFTENTPYGIHIQLLGITGFVCKSVQFSDNLSRNNRIESYLNYSEN